MVCARFLEGNQALDSRYRYAIYLFHALLRLEREGHGLCRLKVRPEPSARDLSASEHQWQFGRAESAQQYDSERLIDWLLRERSPGKPRYWDNDLKGPHSSAWIHQRRWLAFPTQVWFRLRPIR